jgi:hypothetical protein
MLLIYFANVFPHVPSAIGGPSPRCVVVDLTTTELSGSTLMSLLSDRERALISTAALPKVGQTRELQLLFTSSEFVMLRAGDKGPVYAVAKRAIQALVPCSVLPSA